MNTKLSWTLPLSIIPRLSHRETDHRWFMNPLLILLLIMPLLAVAQIGTPNGIQDTGALTGTPSTGALNTPSNQSDDIQPQDLQGGFGTISNQWCTFFPQLPGCLQSGGPPNPIPVPQNWCDLIPTLPICKVQTGQDNRLKPLTNFGSNPGNLDAFKYVPPNSANTSPRPLVVALHGCTQQASNYDDETGWVKFADKFNFVLLLPQQKRANNPLNCFRWFDSNHNKRGSGEALSIKNMIDAMLADTSLNIDKSRVYVTGLSAGGAMTAVMMATYPEMFAGGAPIAGIPYGCARTQSDAQQKCGVKGLVGSPPAPEDLSPSEWGDLVRNASTSSTFPRVSIWQGTADQVVNPQDEREMIDQWTNVLGIDQTPEVDEQFKTTQHLVFHDNAGRPMVEAFFVNNMGHGTPIEPGSADNQCGTPIPYILSAGICSSFYISKFWGLAP